MSLINFSNIQDATTIDANDVNSPLNTIYNDYNGNIDSTNIKAGGVTNGAIATGIDASKLYNPYKFSVYRNAAVNTTTGVFTLVPFDTKAYDTGTNIDVTTNKGRFTAPITGYYHFNACLSFSSVTTGILMATALYKNGASHKVGASIVQGNLTSQASPNISLDIKLNAGDYVEIFVYVSGTFAYLVGSTPINTYFDGFLISLT